MPLDYDLADHLFRVPAGTAFDLAAHDPRWAGDEDIPEKKRKRRAKEILKQSKADLAETQELLYAADSWSMLVIFQAMDAAGKDGAINHVMSGVNPQGVVLTPAEQQQQQQRRPGGRGRTLWVQDASDPLIAFQHAWERLCHVG